MEQRSYGASRYWDWALDSKDPASSPVFDTTTGFGGNGNVSDLAINLSFRVPGFGVVERHAFCVDDGPFANLQSRYNRSEEGLHCLARNFANDTGIGHFDGKLLSRDNVNEMLTIDDYFAFLIAVEDGPHDTIPVGMGGDFESMVAPTDPVFFLHHSQLDRLWWIWQHADASRKDAYNGPVSSSSNDTAARLSDTLSLGDLAPEVNVGDIIDTEGAVLCYRYDSVAIGAEL